MLRANRLLKPMLICCFSAVLFAIGPESAVTPKAFSQTLSTAQTTFVFQRTLKQDMRFDVSSQLRARNSWNASWYNVPFAVVEVYTTHNYGQSLSGFVGRWQTDAAGRVIVYGVPVRGQPKGFGLVFVYRGSRTLPSVMGVSTLVK